MLVDGIFAADREQLSDGIGIS